MQSLIRALGLPQRLRELGVPEDALGTLAAKCVQTQARIVNNNPRTMSAEEAEEILRQAY